MVCTILTTKVVNQVEIPELFQSINHGGFHRSVELIFYLKVFGLLKNRTFHIIILKQALDCIFLFVEPINIYNKQFFI